MAPLHLNYATRPEKQDSSGKAHAEAALTQATCKERTPSAKTYPAIEHLIPIPEGCRRLGVGRSLFYELMSDGKFRTVRLGGRRLVDTVSLAEFAASLPDAGKEK